MAFSYQGQLWCGPCAKQIMDKAILSGGVNREDLPQEVDPDEEWDGVQNCASGECGGQEYLAAKDPGPGAFVQWGTHLELPLSAEGYKSLQGMLNGHGRNLPEFAKEWAEHYGFTWHENPWGSALEWLEDCLKRLWPVGDHEALWQIVSTLVRLVDSDTIQDEFQPDMEEDGYFKKQGWYSSEMEG